MRYGLEPLTVGYDWEMAVLKGTGENISGKEAERLADELRHGFPWAATGTDLELIESRIGPHTRFSSLLDESVRFDLELRKALRSRRWDLLRSGARPFEREPVGAHIHIGTTRDAGTATRVQNGMAAFVAPLAALMANSPVYRGRSGEFKSYRVAAFAEYCSTPQTLAAPGLSQVLYMWSTDVCAKLGASSTVELRVGDSVSSTRLMCEIVALTAGLMHHVAEHDEGRPPSEAAYSDMMLNRWQAARHGLQAVFRADGVGVPVQSVLTEALARAQDGMKRIGVVPDDLRLVRAMIEKRQTQADFQLAVFSLEGGDPHRFTRAMANIQRDPGAFERYLRAAPALGDRRPDEPADVVLARIEIETPYPVILRATPLAATHLDSLLGRLVEKGVVREGRNRLGVRTYTRIGLTAA
jgi:gamma-glutamyl:cysteine ligase YbdK (ATP-grasp superfamily)